jgi:hypothetical protein
MGTNFGLQLAEGHMEMYNSASKSGGTNAVRTNKSAKNFSRNESKNRSQVAAREEKAESEEQLRREDDARNTGKVEHDSTFNAETGSHTSNGSEQMIIRQTTAWDVSYE